VRYAILGDVHGNLEALETALGSLADQSIDRFLQVGDIVGYGADPGACIRILREIGAVIVAGNHDWAVVGKLDSSCFNVYARAAVDWTRNVLAREDLLFLEALPLVEIVDDHITVVHATPDQPELFDYIMTEYDAHRAFESFTTPVCFIGHSHVPSILLWNGNLEQVLSDQVRVGRERALINVGSIGQPRDDNPQLAVGVYDTDTGDYRLHRVAYDIDRAAWKIGQAGLPPVLGERLFYGR